MEKRISVEESEEKIQSKKLILKVSWQNFQYLTFFHTTPHFKCALPPSQSHCVKLFKSQLLFFIPFPPRKHLEGMMRFTLQTPNLKSVDLLSKDDAFWAENRLGPGFKVKLQSIHIFCGKILETGLPSEFFVQKTCGFVLEKSGTPFQRTGHLWDSNSLGGWVMWWWGLRSHLCLKWMLQMQYGQRKKIPMQNKDVQREATMHEEG